MIIIIIIIIIITNTLTGANNDIGHFFLIKGEKNLVSSYIKKICKCFYAA